MAEKKVEDFKIGDRVRVNYPKKYDFPGSNNKSYGEVMELVPEFLVVKVRIYSISRTLNIEPCFLDLVYRKDFDAIEHPKKECVYFILETRKAEDGGYIPCMAIKGEKGYYSTDWNWGPDREIAEQICNEKNAIMGFSPLAVTEIVLSTM